MGISFNTQWTQLSEDELPLPDLKLALPLYNRNATLVMNLQHYCYSLRHSVAKLSVQPRNSSNVLLSIGL
jgi:hypothetical protein